MRGTLWTTTNCNLRCKYCYEKSNNKINILESDIESKILDFIKKDILESESKEHNIQFHGGEPLLNFKLIKRVVNEIEKLRKNNEFTIRYGLTTNGTIWNEEIREFFIKHKKLFEGYISISIDGTKENHNRNRVFADNRGSFDIVYNTAKELLSIFKNIRCRMTVNKENVNELAENIKYIAEEGFSQISVAFDLFDNKWSSEDVDIIKKQYQEIVEYWKENNDIEISLIDEIKYKKKLGRCVAETHFYPDGFIYPCTFAVGNKEFNIGHIDTGLDKEKIDKIAKLSRKDNEICSECKNKLACSSNRCKILNKVVTGDYYKSIPIECVLERIKLDIYKKNKEVFIVD